MVTLGIPGDFEKMIIVICYSLSCCDKSTDSALQTN